ncbi:unnamed protein product [Lupinus luteus]|uniref:Uncharacterized protein n=1 Tax=Lupinus luteus TaxID=3873 RepID=A0AAV1XUC6_LUPLU
MNETETCNKRKKLDGSTSTQQSDDSQHIDEPIKYPIDDLLVKPGLDGPVFTARPSPSRDFNVSMDCITMINWSEYLSDFLEMINIPGLCQYEATIKRGHYGLVDVNAKLEILRELVH